MFRQAVEAVIRREGGFVLTDWANDRGGQTFAGVSRKAHPLWEGWLHVDNLGLKHGQQSDDPALKALVQRLYLEEYWDKCGCQAVKNGEIAAALLDFAVLHGVRTAVRTIQAAVGAVVDGFAGPLTIAAINRFEDAELLLLRLFYGRVARVVRLAGRDPSQRDNLLGWLRRLLEVSE